MATGINKILKRLEVNGSPPPEFETNDERDYLIVTIHQHEAFDIQEVVNGGANDGVNDGANRQNRIINVMQEKPNVTTDQLAVLLSISKRTLEREIKAMKESNIIKRVGSDKTGYWEIVE